MIPYQGTNIASCGPIPTSAPTEEWSSRWGAIAQDFESQTVGVSAEQKSKRSAIKEAIKSCESRGGQSCKIVSTYSDLCIVTVQGVRVANDATAKTPERAEQLGMEACSRRGDSDCHVYYKACSLPVRTR